MPSQIPLNKRHGEITTYLGIKVPARLLDTKAAWRMN